VATLLLLNGDRIGNCETPRSGELSSCGSDEEEDEEVGKEEDEEVGKELTPNKLAILDGLSCGEVGESARFGLLRTAEVSRGPPKLPPKKSVV